jgi:transcriptional regulator with XRE-family HTH domain
MGTSVPAISRLEAGEHMPSTKTLAKVAAALGMDLKLDFVRAK